MFASYDHKGIQTGLFSSVVVKYEADPVNPEVYKMKPPEFNANAYFRAAISRDTKFYMEAAGAHSTNTQVTGKVGVTHQVSPSTLVRVELSGMRTYNAVAPDSYSVQLEASMGYKAQVRGLDMRADLYGGIRNKDGQTEGFVGGRLTIFFP
jgi:hypothetical protein